MSDSTLAAFKPLQNLIFYYFQNGDNYEYRDDNAPKLGEYNDETVVLTLPEGWQVDKFNPYLSIYIFLYIHLS